MDKQLQELVELYDGLRSKYYNTDSDRQKALLPVMRSIVIRVKEMYQDEKTVIDANNEVHTEALTKAIGKKIKTVSLEKNDNGDPGRALQIEFEDGYSIDILDIHQNCCEHRYITSDDKLNDFIGATLTNVEVRNVAYGATEGIGDNYGDIAFLLVTTSIGVFTCESHNEHNGYYGGWIFDCIETKEFTKDMIGA